MSTTHTLSTILCWQDASGEDCETCVGVTYLVADGSPPTQTDPGYDTAVEIDTVVPTSGYPLDERDWTEDDDLKAECLEDWREYLIAAEEYRAEQRRDAMLTEDW